ncbi:MAG: hypothetical protein AAF657_21110 [Acidobacteriota bacterium]
MLSKSPLRALPTVAALVLAGLLSAAPLSAKKPSIELISITPSPGSEVDNQTKISAVVEYNIRKKMRRKKEYSVSIKFTQSPGRTFSTIQKSDDGLSDVHILSEKSGRVELEYSLEPVWSKLYRPIEVWFYLHEGNKRDKKHDGRSVVIAKTAPVTYRSGSVAE